MRLAPFFICLLALTSPLLADTTPAPPEPEQFVDEGHYSQYTHDAQEFLRAHADSPVAPRVAMDLLVTATVFDDQASALKMRKLIVSDYPSSVQAKYVVATLPDASSFAALMADIAADNFDAQPPGFAAHYDQAMRLGLTRFGAAAMGGGPGLVRSYLLANLAGDAQMQKVAVEVLNASGARGDQWRQILLIVADFASPPLNRLQRLHALPDRSAAAPFERYLLGQLPPADRDSINVTQIQADDDLDAGRLQDAAPLLDKLTANLAQSQPRYVFWRAWASAADGDEANAKRLFDELRQQNAADPWARLAAELEPAITGLNANIGRNVEAALSASRHLKTGVDLLEGHATYLRPDAQKLDIYLGINSGKLLDFVIRRQDELAVAYRATDTGASLCIGGNSTIIHFAKPAVLPVPRFGLQRAGTDFVLRGDVQYSTSFDELHTALTGLMASEDLSTRDGLTDVLRSFVRRGALPLAPLPGAGGANVYEWVVPTAAEPAARHIQFTVTPDGTISAVAAGNFVIDHLRYGPAGAFELNAPALPGGQPIDRGPMDVTVLQQLLPAVYGLFTPPPTTQPAATQPAATQP